MLVVVLVQLLAAADPAFARLVVWQVPDGLAPRLVLAVLAALVLLGLGVASLAPPPPEQGVARPSPSPAEWAVPLLLADAVLLVFLLVQGAVLFDPATALAGTGVTPSQWAREGFGQLVAVTVLLLLTLGWAVRRVDRAEARQARLLLGGGGVMSLLALAVVASALSRMAFYTDQFGATSLRLYVVVFEVWLAVVVLLVALTWLRRRVALLPRAVVVTAGAAVLLLAAVGPDGGRGVLERPAPRARAARPGLPADAVGRRGARRVPADGARPVVRAGRHGRRSGAGRLVRGQPVAAAGRAGAGRRGARPGGRLRHALSRVGWSARPPGTRLGRRRTRGPPMPVTTRPLHDGWTLRPAAGPVPDHVRAAGAVPAVVPGTVHTDLLAAGLVPDPYLDDNEALLAWVGLTDWVYSCAFEWRPGAGDRRSLVWHGLDTVATVELNGVRLLEAANQHRTHVADVTDRLVVGANTLTVRFASAVRYVDAQSLAIGSRPHVNHHPYNAVRKTACNFGWDWGPDLVTAGIWRPVELVEWSTVRLVGVRPTTSLTADGGRVAVAVDLERAPGDEAELSVRVSVTGEGATATDQVPVPAGAGTVHLDLDVPGAQPWWPRSHGAQPLSDLVVEVVDGRDEVLADRHVRVGFRDVEWRSTPDEAGTAFTLLVNGEAVFVRGVNWIPDDAFPHRVDRARYARRLAQAVDAGVNLVRVWGGGTYEADAFYDECDERGLLVWQDFLFACACYAEEEPLRGEVVAEVRDNVTRLAPHPSLVLLNGGNENLWGFVDWEWEVRLDGRTWGEGYYHRLLPELLAELDPGRPYVPGSPFSPDGPDGEVRHPNDDAHGLTHVWDVWNQRDHVDYRAHRPRFASEFGWQGPPTWSTLRRSVSDEPLTPESPGMLVHQKAVEGQRKLERGLVRHLPVPDDMRDWHWAMSLNQAWAVRTAVEHLRSLSPHCSGSIVWQLNDCWPVTSWSCVDGDGRAKPTLFALRHAHADRLLTVQPRGGGLAVVVVNDHPEALAADLVVRRLALDGRPLATVTVPAGTPARSTREVPLPAEVSTPADPHGEVLVATLQDAGTDDATAVRGLWFFVEDRDLDLVGDAVRATVERTDDGHRVHVEATALVKDLALLVDGLDPDATVDDMLLTLLPGERATFTVRGAARTEPRALLGAHVLRSANQLVSGAPRRRPSGCSR